MKLPHKKRPKRRKEYLTKEGDRATELRVLQRKERLSSRGYTTDDKGDIRRR